MPTVLNRHHFKGKGLPTGAVYVGRGTPLGNPFTAQENGPNTLDLYREWLTAKVAEGDRAVLAALDAIGPSTGLVCSCAPRPCHADIIAEAWEWRAGKGETATE